MVGPLAETIDDKENAKQAIEFPWKKVKKKCQELTKKLFLLHPNPPEEILDLANNLSTQRNRIVHDKPFELITHHDDSVSVEKYAERSLEPEKYHEHRYETLAEFFEGCDRIKDFVLSSSAIDTVNMNEINFSSLLKNTTPITRKSP